MSGVINTDLCVIGAGSGGLSVAAGAAQMGARVVLVERGKMGGDCLNSGCVPSKSLIAAAHAAHAIRSADRFGVLGQEPEVDFRRVREHVRDVIAAITPHDSVERYQGLGVKVIRDQARFTGPGEIEAGGRRVRARRFVVATGSAPAVPSIPGLEETPYLTNESIFDLDERPSHLVVVGGGPIGIELAQAHRRLGAAVTVLEHATILPKDDPEAVEIVRARLLAEGVELREGAKVSGAAGGRRLRHGRDRRAGGRGRRLASADRRWPPRDVRGLGPRRGGRRAHGEGHQGRRPPAHHEQANFRRWRRDRRPAVHSCRGSSRRHRHP